MIFTEARSDSRDRVLRSVIAVLFNWLRLPTSLIDFLFGGGGRLKCRRVQVYICRSV